MARSMTGYMNRVGRAARAGRAGECISLVGDQTDRTVQGIVETVRRGEEVFLRLHGRNGIVCQTTRDPLEAFRRRGWIFEKNFEE
jgi:superfamily II DNA/RNA helicase